MQVVVGAVRDRLHGDGGAGSQPLRLSESPGIGRRIVPSVAVVGGVTKIGGEGEGAGSIPRPGGPGGRDIPCVRRWGGYQGIGPGGADVPRHIGSREFHLVGGAARGDAAAGLRIGGLYQRQVINSKRFEGC